MNEISLNTIHSVRKRSVRVNQRTGETTLSTPTLQEIRAEAATDSLTGLLSKRVLIRELNAKFMVDRRVGLRLGGKDRRQNEFAPFSVAFCDIDEFAKVNESYGHSVGDTVLQAVAGGLKRNTRGNDQVGRYGGDETVVVFDSIETPEMGLRLTERLREDFAGNFKKQWGITLSIGLVHVAYEDLKVISRIAKHNGVTMADLVLAAADSAAYSAKEEGKDRVASWSVKTEIKPVPEAAAARDKAIYEALRVWQKALKDKSD